MKLERFKNEILDCKIGTFINDDNEIHFRGKDVATALGYENTEQAIRVNVDEEDKDKLSDICRPLEDSGLTFNEKYHIYK